jgi:hypothetical protein
VRGRKRVHHCVLASSEEKSDQQGIDSTPHPVSCSLHGGQLHDYSSLWESTQTHHTYFFVIRKIFPGSIRFMPEESNQKKK